MIITVPRYYLTRNVSLSHLIPPEQPIIFTDLGDRLGKGQAWAKVSMDDNGGIKI